MPALLGRREIGFPSAGATTNKLIAKQAWYVKKKETKILGTAFYAWAVRSTWNWSPFSTGKNKWIDHKAHPYERVCSRLHMYCVIPVMTGQWKTWTAVGRPHLVPNPHFIPELWLLLVSSSVTRKSVFYTQFIICGLQSAIRSPQCMFYSDRVNQHQPCLFPRYVGRHAFSTKTRTIVLFTNMTLNHLGFG